MDASIIIGGVCCGIPLVLLGGIFLSVAVNRRLRRDNYRPREARRVKRGRGKSLTDLATRLRTTPEDLAAFQPRYTELKIPKRSGGTRILSIPDPPTKSLQRKILRLLLAKLRAHPACHGFEKGRSVATNASHHTQKCVLIKIDIRDFFSRTTSARIDSYFRRIGWDKDAAALLTRLTTHQGGLPQGAPTSPRLSNLVNYVLDARLAAHATIRKITYTRYADDITFSCTRDYPRRIRGTIQKTARILKNLGYELNHKKLVIARRHQQQRVTGIIVNDTLNLPRKTRRLLRAIAHHLASDKPATMTPEQLKGYLAYQQMITSQRPKSPPDKSNHRDT